MSASHPSCPGSSGGLLAIFAHPDDESFGPGGTLARYAAESPAIHLLTMTDGALGRKPPKLPQGAGDLAALRAQELRCAARVLSLSQVHQLSYRDSGMAGSPHNRHPGCLLQANSSAIIAEIHRLLELVKPRVVITHDPTGGYFHPDHIRTSELVTKAFRSAQGPQRLYYSAIPRSFIRWAVFLSRLLGRDPSHFGRNRDIDLTRLGTPGHLIHARIEVGTYLAAKLEAMACHKSQGGAESGHPLALPRWLQRRLMAREHFTQAHPIPPSGMPVQGDLFYGL